MFQKYFEICKTQQIAHCNFVPAGFKISVQLQQKSPKFEVQPAEINVKPILIAGCSWLSQKAVFDKLAKLVFVFLLRIFAGYFFNPYYHKALHFGC